MMDFPEWKAGEIVEDDVGEYLDARSARAANMPLKMRRQGRLLPKKSTQISTKQKTLIGFVPNVECDTVDDELADIGLGGSPSEVPHDSRQLPEAPLPRDVPLRPQREPITSAKASRVAPTLSATPPLFTGAPSYTAFTADVSAADLGNTALRHPTPSVSQRVPGTHGIKISIMPRGCSQSTSPPSTPSNRLLTSPLSEVSLAVGDGGTSSAGDSSSMKAAPSFSAPPGVSLPLVRRQAPSSQHDTLCKSLSADSPAPLQAKVSSYARWTSSMVRDRAAPAGRTASASSKRVESRCPMVGEPLNGTRILHSSRITSIVHAPRPLGPKERTASVIKGRRTSKPSSIARNTCHEHIASTPQGNSKMYSGGDSYGDSSLLERTIDKGNRDSLGETQGHTAAPSSASSTKNSVLQWVYDASAQRRSKRRSSVTLPHVDSVLASTIGELRDSTALTPAVVGVSSQPPCARAKATPQYRQSSRNSVPGGIMAPDARFISNKPPIALNATTGRMPTLPALTHLIGHSIEKLNENAEKSVNKTRDSLDAGTHPRSSTQHKNRALRRRTTDFENV